MNCLKKLSRGNLLKAKGDCLTQIHSAQMVLGMDRLAQGAIRLGSTQISWFL